MNEISICDKILIFPDEAVNFIINLFNKLFKFFLIKKYLVLQQFSQKFVLLRAKK